MRIGRKLLIYLAGIQILGLLLASGVPAQDVANRRILDIDLTPPTPEGRYRIAIHMDKISAYSLVAPGSDHRLRVDIGRADCDPALRPRPASNALIQNVLIRPSDSGLLTLEFQLATARVQVSDYSLRSEALIIVDLTLMPETEIETPDAPPPASHGVPDPVAPQHAEGTVEQLPDLTHSAPGQRPVAHATPKHATYQAPSTALPGLPGPSPALPVTPRRISGREKAAREAMDYFPFQEIALQFSDAAEMVDAYKARDYLAAYKIGVKALEKPLPRQTLESLLYLVAECNYQLTKGYQTSYTTEPVPDWENALNHYRQARRFALDSPLATFAQYRMAQVYLNMGNFDKYCAILGPLVRSDALPDLPQALYEFGEGALWLHIVNPSSPENLADAEWGFREFVERYPADENWAKAKMRLGETYYRKGDYEMAFNTMKDVMDDEKLTNIHAHLALAAHKIGKTNLAAPSARKGLARFILASQEPADHLEYARILHEGGDKRNAITEYGKVIRQGLATDATPKEVFEARFALTQIALEDTHSNEKIPTILYKEYTDPVATLEEMYESSYSIAERNMILREQARHLIAQGKHPEAIRFILPHLRPGRLPEKFATELRREIWDVMPLVMDRLEASGEYLQALRVYQGFGHFLDDHPNRNQVLLQCAQIMMGGDLRTQAREAMDRMDPFALLTTDQQEKVTMLRRELRLDPSDPEALKRDAPTLLDPSNDEASRARVLRLLSRVYRDEGEHAYSAQLNLLGAGFESLPVEERMDFYTTAARDYEKANIYSKAIEVYYQGIRQLEELGVQPEDAHDWVGNYLMALGENFRRLGDEEQTATACEQYLKYYPEGAHARAARYFLARANLATDREEEALVNLDALEQDDRGATDDEGFWSQVADGLARQVRWEAKHPYLLKEKSRP